MVAPAIPPSTPIPGQLNLKLFGALCDGVTDDTLAVNRAFTAAATAQALLVVPGMCAVDSAVLPSGLQLVPQFKNRTCGFIRKANATGRYIVSGTNVSGFVIDDGLVFDGNKTNNSGLGGTNISLSGCWDYEIGQIYTRNARYILNGGFGTGITILNNADLANFTSSRVRIREASFNESTGVFATGKLYNTVFEKMQCHDNGGVGFSVTPNPTVSPASMTQLAISDITCFNNSGTGFILGSFITGGTTALPILGPIGYAGAYITARNIRCFNNVGYGAQFIGQAVLADQVIAIGNGNATNGLAGIAWGCNRGQLSNFHSEGNSFFGVDCGFSYLSSIGPGKIIGNGNVQGGIGVNAGASVGLRVHNVEFASNGDQTNKTVSYGIGCSRTDTGGSSSLTIPLTVPFEADGLTVENCTFTYDPAFGINRGVYVTENVPNVRVINNTFRSAVPPGNVVTPGVNGWTAAALIISSSKCEIRGNVSDADIPFNAGYTAQTTLIFPDMNDALYVVGGDAAGLGPITTLYPYSENYFLGAVTALKTVKNSATNFYRVCPITVTGGGGSGASGMLYPDDTGTGASSKIPALNGTGFTSIPTATANLTSADLAAGATPPTITAEINNTFMKDGLHNGVRLTFALSTTVVSGTGNIDLANGLTTTFPAGATLLLKSFNGRWAEQNRSLPIRGSSALGLTATGTTQTTALQLTADFSEVTTVAAGTGVVVPVYSAIPGDVRRVRLVNAGLNTLKIYPPTGGSIFVLNGSTAAQTANAAVTLAAGTYATFELVSAALSYMGP